MAIIQGQVLDPQNRPLAGVSVYFVSSPVSMPDIALLTDSNGCFKVSVPVLGIYVLAVRSDEWGTLEKAVEAKEEMVFIKMQFNIKEK